MERNLRFGVEQVNAQGGVRLAEGAHPLELVVLDSKGSAEEALVQLRAAADQRIGYIMQGNSSAVAAALIGAIDKQNSREPANRELFLNYSAGRSRSDQRGLQLLALPLRRARGHAHGCTG